MSSTELLCLRMDRTTLAKLDRYATFFGRRNRSKTINHLLKTLLDCAEPGTIDRMLDIWDPYAEGYVVRFGRPQK